MFGMNKVNGKLILGTVMLSLFITGCGGQITIEEIKKGEGLCEKNGGLNHLFVDDWSDVRSFTCKDNAMFYNRD